MKISFPFSLLLFVPFFSFSQIGPAIFLDQSVGTAGVTQFVSADFNNDGFKEIMTSTTGSNGRLGYYQKEFDNTFSAFHLIENLDFCRGFAVADFNNDSWIDLVSISGINNTIKIHSNNSGTFSAGVFLDNLATTANDVVVADFDSDNFIDFVVIGQHSIDLFRNNGNGSFTKEEILTTSTSPLQLECLDLAAEDMDNDGDIDLICGETAGMVVYINNGDGIFTPNYYSLIPEVFFLIHVFDIDGDGDLDVVGKKNGDFKWFRNNGAGVLTFEASLTSLPMLTAVKSIDYNNDGFEDLYVSYPNHISIFENDANHTFSNEVIVYQDNSLSMGKVQIIDIDGQNGLDYIWSGASNTIAYHLNQSPSSLSLSQLDAEANFMYPNPTNGMIYFMQKAAEVSVYSVQGTFLFQRNHVYSIDLEGFPAGMYVVVEKNANTLIQQRIVKK